MSANGSVGTFTGGLVLPLDGAFRASKELHSVTASQIQKSSSPAVSATPTGSRTSAPLAICGAKRLRRGSAMEGLASTPTTRNLVEVVGRVLAAVSAEVVHELGSIET